MSRRKGPDVRYCFPGIPDFTAGQKKLADILKKDGYEVQIFREFLGNLSCGKGRKELEDAKIISMHGRSQNFIYAVANHEKNISDPWKKCGKRKICEKLKILPSGNK